MTAEKKVTLQMLTKLSPEPQALWRKPDGTVGHAPLVTAAYSEDFEHVPAVREQKNHRGKTWFAGRYWAATGRKHVVYESWLERKRITLLDHDPDVVGLVGQPMWLCGRAGGKHWEHRPDLFVRHADGTASVVEVKTERRAAEFRRSDRHAHIVAACEEVGWEYKVVTEPDPQTMANVAWLAGYRHDISDPHGTQDALVAACTAPTPLVELVEQVDDPLFALPHLWRALWLHRLTVDLTQPIRSWTLVHPSPKETQR